LNFHRFYLIIYYDRALDGYPVYGPFGYSNPQDASSSIVRMIPCYKLISSRSGSGAPSISEYALGSFNEDYIC
jgi:hypothetical protein